MIQPNAITTNGAFEFEALECAANYRAALIEEFRPHLSGLVVEVGAGVGQFAAELLKTPTVTSVVAIEPEKQFCSALRKNCPTCQVVEGTLDDLPADVVPDAIVCVNVLEHIEHDEAELRKFARRLTTTKGRVCLFVPAGPEIYAPIDRDFGHFRRYTRAELRQKLEAAGFVVERLDYFNSAGYVAWWFSHRLLRRRGFDTTLVALFDRLIFPVVNAVEKRIRPPFGQSLLAVARPR